MDVGSPYKMKKSDAWWLLAYPIYQFIGTSRHEFSHAAAAIWQGAHITGVKLLPSVHPTMGFLWGYVNFKGGHPDWVTISAPYFCDLLTFACFGFLCIHFRRMPHWLWLNVFVL